MGQLRTAVRAYARLDLPPHEVLQLLDGLATEIDPHQIATCVYCRPRPERGPPRLRVRGPPPDPRTRRERHDPPRRRADGPAAPAWRLAARLGRRPARPRLHRGHVHRRPGRAQGRGHRRGVAALEHALAGATGTPQVVCRPADRERRASPPTTTTTWRSWSSSTRRARAPTANCSATPRWNSSAASRPPPRARAFASGVLSSWRFTPELTTLGVLAASELVANSLQHGTPPMRLGCAARTAG